MKWCLVFALSVFSVGPVHASPVTEEVKAELQKIVNKAGIPNSDIGLYITTGEAENLEVVLDVNAKRKMIPASISKVVTASAVLESFPPGFKFKTELLSNGVIHEETLKGDLILKGGGDPGFVAENLWYLVNHFKRNDVQKIEGDIIIDDSMFDKMRFDTSRQAQRVDRAYDAPVGAMSFNWNSVNIFVRPGEKAGDPARVYLDPENDYIRLVNRTKTSAGSGNALAADRKEDKNFNGDVIHVGGSIGKSSKEIVIYKNIMQPDLWAGYNLKSFLLQRGITVTGKVRNGIAPDKARVLAEFESKGIEQNLADMNKFSNNYVAEMLTKNMGASKSTPGTLDAGMQMINDHLARLEIPADQYYMQNPSGLTRDNKLSAFAMNKVLIHLRNDFKVQPEFLTSLPIAGIDGTLKKRMKNTPGERWVRAKTGYLTNVVTLAGYAGRKDGRVYTFTFIFNGAKDEATVRSFFDQMLVSLVK